MLAKVTASTLNIRSIPSTTGSIIGKLPEGAVVDIIDTQDNWNEISHKDSIGFAYSLYLEPSEPASKALIGVVSAGLLNVRDEPGLSGTILGTVNEGTALNILAQYSGWLEIEFNHSIGYVSQKYVQLFAPGEGYVASVTAELLNVRAAPSLSASILGQLAIGTSLKVEASFDFWGKIAFNGIHGYVHGDYLRKLAFSEDADSPPVEEDDHEEVLPPAPTEEESEKDVITPKFKYPISGSSHRRNAARTWNNYGGLLESLSKQYGIDVACAVAVLCVESSGKGFEQNNRGSMIIRFENHKFWKYWGKSHAADFRDHFKYSSGKVWTGHKWRRSSSQSWQTFHGNQGKEWEVFEFAKSLNADAAMQSISMGAPQIMGFHFERIGYQSVEEMFNDFSNDITAHINGLFAFFSESMVKKLRRLDFEGFAAGYNGSGQKEKYGKWIRSHYKAFKELQAKHQA